MVRVVLAEAVCAGCVKCEFDVEDIKATAAENESERAFADLEEEIKEPFIF